MKSVTGCAGAVMVARVLVHYYPSQFILHIMGLALSHEPTTFHRVAD